MGITKTDNYTVKQNAVANLLKALAHPARIAIIQHLRKSKHCSCGDFVNQLGLAQATVSQHLKELKTIGVIKGCVEGTSVSYCINEKVWKRIRTELDSIFADDKLMKK